MVKAGGVADDVSSHLLRLWIDLVRQAESVPAAIQQLVDDDLTPQHFRALSCLPAEGLTMEALARSLSTSAAGATVLADHLTRVGAAVLQQDRVDSRAMRLVATTAGAQLAQDDRLSQVATLEHLLDQMKPARLAVLNLAMLAVKKLVDGVTLPESGPPGPELVLSAAPVEVALAT
jgi:DNA-binding MarR family transcriptional regulator